MPVGADPHPTRCKGVTTMARSKKTMEAVQDAPVVEEAAPAPVDTSLTVKGDDWAITVSPAMLEAYVSAGFAVAEVEGYERDAMAIREGMDSSARAFVEVGELLTSAKSRQSHGSWAWWLMRVGISQATAERTMAAYEASVSYPQLVPLLGSFGTTALAAIGQRKDVTPEAVAEIVALAESGGEATLELVLDEIRAHAAAKPAKVKKHKTFFKLIPPERASVYRTDVQSYLNKVTGLVVNAGANLPGLQKSPDFKAYVKGIGGEGETELQRSLQGLLLAAYIFDHPEEGDPNAAPDLTDAPAAPETAS